VHLVTAGKILEGAARCGAGANSSGNHTPAAISNGYPIGRNKRNSARATNALAWQGKRAS
jgi:hypothetical protein